VGHKSLNVHREAMDGDSFKTCDLMARAKMFTFIYWLAQAIEQENFRELFLIFNKTNSPFTEVLHLNACWKWS